MIAMLVPLLAILAADPSPAPASAAAPPTALKEIGRIQALPVCTAIVVHANSAISNALTNDQDVAVVINHLRTTDLDGANPMQWHQRTTDLFSLAERIRTASSAGEAEVKRLRTLAATAPDPKRKDELKSFADALGGALYRQKRVGVDLDKALAIINGRRAVAEAGDLVRSPGQFTSTQTRGPDGMSAGAPFSRRENVNDSLKDIADEFTGRTQLILNDEGVAADHSLGAMTGC
ncbi:MAG: hypothetical protein NVSMB64_09390 [Candidatus Velthaea sp.]